MDGSNSAANLGSMVRARPPWARPPFCFRATPATSGTGSARVSMGHVFKVPVARTDAWPPR